MASAVHTLLTALLGLLLAAGPARAGVAEVLEAGQAHESALGPAERAARPPQPVREAADPRHAPVPPSVSPTGLPPVAHRFASVRIHVANCRWRE